MEYIHLQGFNPITNGVEYWILSNSLHRAVSDLEFFFFFFGGLSENFIFSSHHRTNEGTEEDWTRRQGEAQEPCGEAAVGAGRHVQNYQGQVSSDSLRFGLGFLLELQKRRCLVALKEETFDSIKTLWQQITPNYYSVSLDDELQQNKNMPLSDLVAATIKGKKDHKKVSFHLISIRTRTLALL